MTFHRCQDFVEKKRQFPEAESITTQWGMAGPFIGVGVGRVGGGGGDPKSPYHMPRKILLKENSTYFKHLFVLFFVFVFNFFT